MKPEQLQLTGATFIGPLDAWRRRDSALRWRREE
jgi:hypothetical protein